MKRLATIPMLLAAALLFAGCATYRATVVRHRTVYRTVAAAPAPCDDDVVVTERIEVEGPDAPGVDDRSWIEENYVRRDSGVVVVEEPAYVYEEVDVVDPGWSLWLDLGWRSRNRSRSHRAHRSGGWDGHDRGGSHRAPPSAGQRDHTDRDRSHGDRSRSGRHERSDRRSGSRGDHDRSSRGDRGGSQKSGGGGHRGRFFRIPKLQGGR